MALQATCWEAGRRIGMESDYDAGFVDALKQEVPPYYRRWDAREKVWYFDAKFWPRVESLLKEFGYDFTFERDDDVGSPPPPPPPRPPPRTPPPDPYAMMLRAAPDEALKKVYRLLTTYLHPDRGGDTEKMKQINVAWDRIAKERGL